MHCDLALGSVTPVLFVTGISMQDLRNDTQRRHRGTADAYRRLSAGDYDPEVAFLEEAVFGQVEQALMTSDSKWTADVRPLGACFRDASQEDLRLDYTRLFIGPFHIRSKPYGSVYLDRGNIVMGDSTIAALALYSEGGFQVAEAFEEMPDHVAVELEFLYLLHARLGDSDSDTGERDSLAALERRFLATHLGRWITPFSKAMEEGARTDFYRKLADLTRRLVLDDLREPATAPQP
mgnify:FL=1